MASPVTGRLFIWALTLAVAAFAVNRLATAPQPLGWLNTTGMPQIAGVPPKADPQLDPKTHERQARAAEVNARFEQSAAMLHAKQYDYAIAALHRVLELAPRMPEAHVNMGYALLGLKRYQAAGDFFNSAIELRPAQANAYYGLALALEGQGELEGALGAMRSFAHLARADDPYRQKALAALWEWETKLGRRSAQDPAPAPLQVPSSSGKIHPPR